MASSPKQPWSERRKPMRPWAPLTVGGLILGVVAAKASAGWLDTQRVQAEPSTNAAPARGSGEEAEQLQSFVLGVLRDADATWAADFRRRNKPYASVVPVLRDSPSAEDCGPGVALRRPGCYGVNDAFVDLSFQRDLGARLGEAAEGARAYAIAHELGHHVQRVLGMDRKLDQLLVDKRVASHWVEVQLELQADCLAGVWSRRSRQQYLVDPTRIEAALRSTSELGTELRLANEGAGSAAESFTYAIPRRRIYWFAQGYARGEIDDCDTFAP